LRTAPACRNTGDALPVHNAYAALTADQQSQIQELLGTLGRQENIDAAPINFLLSLIRTTPGRCSPDAPTALQA
jgi:HPt (histidine-containing phosphotransfer) domain-containing protein